jgi:hypothetical protein
MPPCVRRISYSFQGARGYNHVMKTYIILALAATLVATSPTHDQILILIGCDPVRGICTA